MGWKILNRRRTKSLDEYFKIRLTIMTTKTTTTKKTTGKTTTTKTKATTINTATTKTTTMITTTKTTTANLKKQSALVCVLKSHSKMYVV